MTRTVTLPKGEVVTATDEKYYLRRGEVTYSIVRNGKVVIVDAVLPSWAKFDKTLATTIHLQEAGVI